MTRSSGHHHPMNIVSETTESWVDSFCRVSWIRCNPSVGISAGSQLHNCPAASKWSTPKESNLGWVDSVNDMVCKKNTSAGNKLKQFIKKEMFGQRCPPTKHLYARRNVRVTCCMGTCKASSGYSRWYDQKITQWCKWYNKMCMLHMWNIYIYVNK